MQPIRNNFRPAGSAYSDHRPPLLATGPRPLLSMHGNERLTSSGARSGEGQTIPLPVEVTARGHEAGFGGRDQASEKAEAEKYTALFSRMLQENIFLSGLSNPALPRAVSPPSSTILPRLNPTQQMGQMQDGFGRHRHPGPVTPNRMSFQGPCPTERNLAEASTIPADLLGWTASSTSHQGLTTMTLPPPPFPPITMTVPPSSSSVNRLSSVAPPGHLYAPAALPLGVPPPVSSQYHPSPTMNSFTPSGPRWSSNPASSVVPVRGCSGRTTDVTASREVPEGGGRGGFLTKSLEGLQSSDIILSRANQMLAQNLFEMTSTKNHDDNNNDETTFRHRDSHDSRSTYSSSQGRPEDGGGAGGGGRRRRRRRRSSGEEHHRRSSRKKSRRSRSRSSFSSSSTSAESTPSSSSSSFVCTNSGPQYNAERNYRNRLDDNKSSTKRKSEFCRICEIKIKGSFLAHRRGKAHIRKESSVQSGCDLCGVRCFNTFSEYETHRSSEEHLQRRSDEQNQIDLENRKRLGLPETKVVIIRNADGREQEEELEKLDRLRKMARNRNGNRISGEEEEEEGKKQEEEEEEDEERQNGKNDKEMELEARCCSTDIKDGRDSSEWNAGGTNGPEVMSLARCLGDQDDDVIIDLTGRSEEEVGKQMEDVERSSEVKVVAVKDKDDVTRLMNDHTQVTSTTADKTSKDDCLGREWIVPVTGFFCKVCLKFFSANSGEADVTAHCTSARHREYYQEHVTTRAKRNQSSSTSTSLPSSSIPSSTSSSSTSTLVSPPNAGRCGIVYDEKKRVKEIIIWRNSENASL